MPNSVGVSARAAIPFGDGKDKIYVTLESSTDIDPTNPTTPEQRAEARKTLWEEVEFDLNHQIAETSRKLKEQL